MKEAKEYWEGLSIKQQDHFLKDHKSEFNRSSWLGWLGKDFDKLPANVQKVISKHVEEGIYKSGGSFSDFLAKAKTKAKSAYSTTKKGAKELSVKAKETYSKTEKAVKDKVKEQKRKIAVDVINDTDNKVKTKEEHIYLDRARQIVANKYKTGGGFNENLLEFTIPTWAISSLINSDDSGLEDEDIEKVNRFVDKIQKRYGNANFMLGDKSEETEFNYRNDIDGNLGGDVTTLYLIPSKKYAKGTNINKENYDINYLFSELTKIYTNRDSETYKELRVIKFKANKEVDFWDLVWAIGTDLQEKTQNKFQVKEKDGFYTWANRLAEHVCEELAYMLLKKEGISLEKQSEDEYAKGTNIKKVDLFEHYELIPKNVQEVLDHYSQSFEDGDYAGLQNAQEELENIGYTFEYGLDGQAYALRPIGVKVEELEGYEEYCCGGQMYRTGGNMTKYVFVSIVQGNYGYGWEDLTAHDTRLEAKKEMKVYDENERYPHRVITRKVLRTDYDKGNYATGGQFEHENREMVLNNNKQIAHHTKELEEAVKDKHVPAWVVAKVNRSASDLSDATHYMEGHSEQYAKGTNIDTDEYKYVAKYSFNKEESPLQKDILRWGNSVKDVLVKKGYSPYQEHFGVLVYAKNKVAIAKLIKEWSNYGINWPHISDFTKEEKYAKGTNVSSDWTKELTNDENELACSVMNRIVKPGPHVDCNNLKYAVKSELKKAIESNMNMFSTEGKKIATSLLSKLN